MGGASIDNMRQAKTSQTRFSYSGQSSSECVQFCHHVSGSVVFLLHTGAVKAEGGEEYSEASSSLT